MITTLFNIFCPILIKFRLLFSVFVSVIIVFILAFFLRKVVTVFPLFKETLSKNLFPLAGARKIIFLRGCLFLGGLNLASLIIYSFPVTTYLPFNLSFAFYFWFSSLCFFFLKTFNVSVLLPKNSPWYLARFLCLIELIRLSVRPITLGFRLLANIRAGHILLSLICKLPKGVWILGSLFGLLELIVCLVQSFVFLILVRVYLEESASH